MNIFSYDHCEHLHDGTIVYVGCVLQDRVGQFFPGDQFDTIVVDYHAGTVGLYIYQRDSSPAYEGSIRVSLA